MLTVLKHNIQLVIVKDVMLLVIGIVFLGVLNMSLRLQQ